MNFEIYDDEFKEEKPEYVKTIYKLSNELIEKEKRKDWDLFVSRALTNTRSYYIIETALKVMQNLNKKQDYDESFFNALGFMPDQSFVEMVVAIVSKYHKVGYDYAKHYNIDMKPFEQKPEDKSQEEKEDKKEDKPKNELKGH